MFPKHQVKIQLMFIWYQKYISTSGTMSNRRVNRFLSPFSSSLNYIFIFFHFKLLKCEERKKLLKKKKKKVNDKVILIYMMQVKPC